MLHLSRFLAVTATIFLVVIGSAQGQNSTPCPPPADGLTQVSNSVDKSATTVASTGTTVAAAETKLKGIFSKPKTAAAATTPATTPAAAPSAASAAAAPAAKPCPTPKPASAAATPAPSAATASAQPAPVKQTAAASTSTVSVISGSPSFTLMPDGQYMVAYDSPDPGHKKAYVKVKKVSDGTQAGHPNDGVYTDDKNYYVVTGGQMVLTPANTETAH
jgi:hypothetical protein